MGRMRKEIMGRPPHSVLPSICFRVSLNAVLLVLTDGKKEGSSAHPAVLLHKLVPLSCCYSQQHLQRPLLESLVGAVDNVGFKVVGSVVLNNIANVPDHWIVIVTPLKVLKKPENGEGEVSNEVCFSSHRLMTSAGNTQLCEGLFQHRLIYQQHSEIGTTM